MPVKSSHEKDNTARSFLTSFAGLATVVAFLYPTYALGASCLYASWRYMEISGSAWKPSSFHDGAKVGS